MRNILESIKTPTLLVDLQKAQKNVNAMQKKAQANQVMLRPHFKTHQSAQIGELYRQAGVTAITVSSVDMGAYFAAAGWKDILIAFPVNWREMDRINELAEKVRLAVLVDSMESVSFLREHANQEMGVWIKIDTGLHRAGIWWQDMEEILALAKKIEKAPMLTLEGILTHAGQTYHATCAEDVLSKAMKSKQAMLEVKTHLETHGVTNTLVSIGDTPGCRALPDFKGVDEIRPGNFIFFDLEQWYLGACQAEEIAVAVACPIVSKNASRNELVIYGGAIHFAKETLNYQGKPIYGLLADMRKSTFNGIQPESMLINTTQEHGILKVPAAVFDQYSIGGVAVVYPVHSCLVVQALGAFTDIETGTSIASMVQHQYA